MEDGHSCQQEADQIGYSHSQANSAFATWLVLASVPRCAHLARDEHGFDPSRARWNSIKGDLFALVSNPNYQANTIFRILIVQMTPKSKGYGRDGRREGAVRAYTRCA